MFGARLALFQADDGKEDMADKSTLRRASESKSSVGSRIREARDEKNLSQAELAKLLGLSRAAVAQWESDTTSPSIATAAEVARLLGKPPQWLAYGVSGEPQIVYRSPEQEGYTRIREIAFGDKPDAVQEVAVWGAPTTWVKQELHCVEPAGLMVYAIETTNMEPELEYGDRIVVDSNTQRPSPAGLFLHWDGVGPAVNHITVIPGAGGKKPMARVSSTDGKTESYEIPVDSLKIVGRVRGFWRKV